MGGLYYNEAGLGRRPPVSTLTMALDGDGEQHTIGSAALTALAFFLDQVCCALYNPCRAAAHSFESIDESHRNLPHRPRSPLHALRWGRVLRRGRDGLRGHRQARQAARPPAPPRAPRRHEGTGEEDLRVSRIAKASVLELIPCLCSMPSTHSAVITHYAVYIPLACAFLPIHPALPDAPWTRSLPPLIAVPWACAIVYSRIWLGHHTWPQCLAGCLYGAVFALAWFKLWTGGISALGQAVERRVHDAL